MSTDVFNRFQGARSTFGVKKPVRAATTANIVLSGFQTIDGITYASTDVNLNMRCLVKNQADGTQNGIYTVNSGAWTREVDFDGNTDFTRGTLVFVSQGATNGNNFFYVSSADPQNIGVSAINFTALMLNTDISSASVASATTTDLGADVAQCITVTGDVTITSFGASAPTGSVKYVYFSGNPLLTHNAVSLILPGAENIYVAAGDVLIIRHEGGGNWRAVDFCRNSAAVPGRMLSVNVTPASTTGSTLESTLMSYSMGGAQLAQNGYGVRILAWGSVAATTIAKEIKLYFGGTAVGDTGSLVLNGLSWRMQSEVYRISTAAQTSITSIQTSSTATLGAICQGASPAEVLGSTASPVTIKITGQALTTISTAITASGLSIELLTV